MNEDPWLLYIFYRRQSYHQINLDLKFHTSTEMPLNCRLKSKLQLVLKVCSDLNCEAQKVCVSEAQRMLLHQSVYSQWQHVRMWSVTISTVNSVLDKKLIKHRKRLVGRSRWVVTSKQWDWLSAVCGFLNVKDNAAGQLLGIVVSSLPKAVFFGISVSVQFIYWYFFLTTYIFPLENSNLHHRNQPQYCCSCHATP